MRLKCNSYFWILTSVLALASCKPIQQKPISPSQTEIPNISTPPIADTQITQTPLGTVDGGGGRVIVCKDLKDPSKKTAQILDLYEAQNILKLTLITPLGSTDEQWLSFMHRYAESLQENINDKVDYSKIKTIQDLENIIGTPGHRIIEEATPKGETLRDLFNFQADFRDRARYIEDIKLRKIDDSRETFETPENCTIEQVINYRPDDTILIQKLYWNQLNEQNRTALMAHEYVYREYRKLGAKTSVQTRKVIGHMFSDTIKKEGSVLNAGGILCMDIKPKIPSARSLWLFPGDRGKDESTIFFINYPGQLLILPTVTHFSTLMLFEHIKKLNSCIDGSNNEALEIEDGADAPVEVETTYFHDTYDLKYVLKCPVNRTLDKNEFNISLKNLKTKETHIYKCSTEGSS